jgi:class 3 adenylate cyclase
LSNIILDEQGTIDKFMGDAVMAFWNAPFERHREFLALYRAKALSFECEKLNSARLDRLYVLYRERIEYFRINPLPPQWDGTAEALSK